VKQSVSIGCCGPINTWTLAPLLSCDIIPERLRHHFPLVARITKPILLRCLGRQLSLQCLGPPVLLCRPKHSPATGSPDSLSWSSRLGGARLSAVAERRRRLAEFRAAQGIELSGRGAIVSTGRQPNRGWRAPHSAQVWRERASDACLSRGHERRAPAFRSWSGLGKRARQVLDPPGRVCGSNGQHGAEMPWRLAASQAHV